MGTNEEPEVRRRTATSKAEKIIGSKVPCKVDKILGSKADKVLGGEPKTNVDDGKRRSCLWDYAVTWGITTAIFLVILCGTSLYRTDTFFFRQDDIVLAKLRRVKKNGISLWIDDTQSQIRTRPAVDLERQITPEELERHSGIDESLPVYISFHRHVFDVSSGREYYTRDGGSYGTFGGRDATRAFITGEFEHDLTCDLTGLTDEQTAGVGQWLDFYKTHEEYVQVGVLAYDYECPKALTPEELKAAKAKSKEAAKKVRAERDAATTTKEAVKMEEAK